MSSSLGRSFPVEGLMRLYRILVSSSPRAASDMNISQVISVSSMFSTRFFMIPMSLPICVVFFRTPLRFPCLSSPTPDFGGVGSLVCREEYNLSASRGMVLLQLVPIDSKMSGGEDSVFGQISLRSKSATRTGLL